MSLNCSESEGDARTLVSTKQSTAHRRGDKQYAGLWSQRDKLPTLDYD